MSRAEEYNELIKHINLCSEGDPEMNNRIALIVLKKRLEREILIDWLDKNKDDVLRFIHIESNHGGLDELMQYKIRTKEQIRKLKNMIDNYSSRLIPKHAIKSYTTYKELN